MALDTIKTGAIWIVMLPIAIVMWFAFAATQLVFTPLALAIPELGQMTATARAQRKAWGSRIVP